MPKVLEPRPLTEDELKLIHYNPNTIDIVEFIHSYAQEYGTLKAHELNASLREQVMQWKDIAHKQEARADRLTNAMRDTVVILDTVVRADEETIQEFQALGFKNLERTCLRWTEMLRVTTDKLKGLLK